MSLRVRIEGNTSHLDRALAHSQKGIMSLVGGAASFAAKLGGIGLALAGVASAAQSIQTVGTFLKESSQAASNFEDLTIQFEVLTKSASKTADLLQQMREEAQKSPLSVADYAQAGQKLLQTGKAAEEVMPILKMIGDVSMGNSERFERLAYAYSQVIDNTRLMGTEVIQLANAGFGPLSIIAERTGESIAELRKRMETTGISADELTQAFVDATGANGRFHQAIQRGAESTAGKIAKFQDAILSLKIAFGEGLNEGVKSFMMSGSGIAEGLENIFKKSGTYLGTAIQQAINGDIGMFVDAGALAGRALIEGMKIAAKAGLFEVRALMAKGFDWVKDTADVFNLEPPSDKAGAFRIRRQAEYEKSIKDATNALRATFENRITPHTEARELYNQGVRSGDPGYRGTEMGKMLSVLEKIERKTAPLKF